MVIFGGCFTIDIYLEKDLLKQNYLEQMTVKEVPDGFQNIIELIVEMLDKMVEGTGR